MSEKKKSSNPPRKTSSGNIPAVDPATVEAMRAKMDSIMENTIPLMDKSIEALENAISSSHAPPTTERPASPVPPFRASPVIPEESETTPVPTTRPSPSNEARQKYAVESDPFGTKKE